MARKIEQILELGRKVRILQDWAATAGEDILNSEHAIARSAGIKRSTLKSNIRDGQMSSANQEKLGKVFGFRANWPEWRDPEAIRTIAAGRRRDTAEAFRDRFLASKSKVTCLTIEAGVTEKYLDRRFADFSFAVAGSFDPLAASDQIPLVLSLSFDRRGWPVLLQGTNEVLTVGLKQADLQLFPDRESAKGAQLTVSEISCHSGAEGNFRGNVEGLAPWWVISVTAGDGLWLMGRRLRNDGQDCVCQGFRAGDKIRAILTARANDCFVKVEGEPFEGVSEAKIRFIEHLHKLAVLKGTEAVLGEQTLTVIAKL
jgi:hypothetical protein